MPERAHLEEFLANVDGKLARNLVEAYQVGIRDSTLSPLDIVSRLKSTMEQALEDESDEAA